MSDVVKYNFTYDMVFKSALTKCPKGAIKLIKEFVPDLKDIDKNEEVVFLDKENIIGLDIQGTVFDINLQIATNLVELEMQKQDMPYVMQNRMLKYFVDITNNSFEKGGTYKHQACYSLWFLGFKLFDDDEAFHSFELYDKDADVRLVEDAKIITVEFVKFKEKDYNDNIWYKIFVTSDLSLLKGDDPIMNELVEEIKNLNNDKEFVLRIDARERALREQNAMLEAAEEKGIEQGIEKGIEQGRYENKIEVAKNAKSIGLSCEQIIKLTGLSKEEIESL